MIAMPLQEKDSIHISIIILRNRENQYSRKIAIIHLKAKAAFEICTYL